MLSQMEDVASKIEYIFDEASPSYISSPPARELDCGKHSCMGTTSPFRSVDSVTVPLQRNGNASSSGLKELFSSFQIDSAVIPSEILVRTRELCAKYLGGAWTVVSPERFRLRAITGGMSNLLFLVELPDDLKPVSSEPAAALLRIHCDVDLEHLINESVVFTILSERSLGPKLLGVFPGGRFEQFIPSRPLLCHELSLPCMTVRLGTLLARIHVLDVPILKEPMVIPVAEEWLGKLFRLENKMSHKMRLNMVQVDISKCPATITCQVLEEELNILKRCLDRSDSPIVFCHNDLQEGNILLQNKYELDCDGNLNVPNGEDPLVLIDFEYASYNYRGFDFANHVCEFTLDYSNNKPPFYSIYQNKFPDEFQQRLLVNAYLDEVESIVRNADEYCRPPYFASELPQKREDAVQQLLTETRRFIAVSHLFWSIWSFKQDVESPIEFDYISYGLDRLALYYKHKSDLLEYLST